MMGHVVLQAVEILGERVSDIVQYIDWMPVKMAQATRLFNSTINSSNTIKNTLVKTKGVIYNV